MTGEFERVRGNCPQCGPGKWGVVKGKYTTTDSNEFMSWGASYRIVECPACETAYFQSSHWNSEDYNHVQVGAGANDFEIETIDVVKQWPDYVDAESKKAIWLPELQEFDAQLAALFEDVTKAIEAQLEVFAVVGLRTCFDRASELVGIDPAITFQEKLDELLSQGRIGETEKDLLAIATDAGNAAAHRGWKPSKDELNLVKQTVEAFVYRNFILKDGLGALRNSVPKKQKRKRKTTS